MGAPKLQQKYTYSDYKTWPDNERWELINGEAYDMSPAPKTAHQKICLKLAAQFDFYLSENGCQVFIAPFDVRLYSGVQREGDTNTVVQPDISIFCDESKLDEKGAHAAPDLIVEILSESTRDKDQVQKLLLYQRHKVTEYWIVDPDKKIITQFVLTDNLYQIVKEYQANEIISPSIFPNLEVDIERVFK